MMEIRIKPLSVEGMFVVFLSLMLGILLGLRWNIPIEEFYLLSLENPMWAFHISGGLAFITTLVIVIVIERLNRQNKGE